MNYKSWWDLLMDEQLDFPQPKQQAPEATENVSPYNVGDVIIGEIVEEEKELTA